MKQSEIEAFARKAAKGIKTEKDLCDFSRILKKVAVETALNAGSGDIIFNFHFNIQVHH